MLLTPDTFENGASYADLRASVQAHRTSSCSKAMNRLVPNQRQPCIRSSLIVCFVQPRIFELLLELADFCDAEDVRHNAMRLLDLLPTDPRIQAELKGAFESEQPQQAVRQVLQPTGSPHRPAWLLYVLQVSLSVQRLQDACPSLIVWSSLSAWLTCRGPRTT